MISPDRRLVFVLCLGILLGSLPSFSQASAPEVLASGSLSSRSIFEDELLQFTVTIANKTDAKKGEDESLYLLTLVRPPDSYSWVSICVTPSPSSPSENCQSAESFKAGGNQLAERLAPGESLMVRGYLHPDTVHKNASLTSPIQWTVHTANGDKISSAKPVMLGENQVQSSSWWGRLSIDEVLKVLAIPALLLVIGAVAGLIVNVLNSSRDRRVHANEAERSLRAETWKQMLPVSHNYAAKFYLPLSLSAERFSKSLKAGKTRVAFFYLLYSGKKAIATRNEIGGFYFKDLRGEILAAQCWEKQRLACMGEEETPFFLAVRASIDELDEIDSYEAFETMFAATPGGDFSNDSVQEAWTHFKTWVAKTAEVAKTTKYLDSFVAVLDYESNRPYQYWYDSSKPRLVATDVTKGILRDVLVAEKYTDADITDYLRAVVPPS